MMHPSSDRSPRFGPTALPGSLSRRDVLRSGVAVAAGGLLAACGSDKAKPGSSGSAVPSAGSTASSGSAKKGGNLRVGISTGSVADTVDAHKPFQLADQARLACLYDPWSLQTPDMQGFEQFLAVEYTPNSAGDTWTVKLRPDVQFHNGKTLTADDAIFSIQRTLDPATAAPAATLFAPIIDPKGVTKVDSLTVQFKLLRPHWNLEALLNSANIVPVDYDPAKPVGTGPFKFKSFTPGQSSVFVAHENYWKGRPLVDQLSMVDLTDDTARLNALVGGQVDAIAALAFSQIAVIEGNSALQLIEGPSSAWYPIRMDCRTKPFNDARVRQAFRLLANRKQMVEQVYLGHGFVGNDLYSPFDEVSAQFPQREQDVNQAISLLTAAGVKDESFEFTAANLGPGTLEYATVFSQQATAAGVNVKITVVDPSVYSGPDFLKWKIANSQWPAMPYLTQVGFADGPNAAYAETGFGDVDAEFAKLYSQAVTTIDAAARKQICQQMQKVQYDRGGYIVWGFPNSVDAATVKTTGYTTHKNGTPLGNFNFLKVGFV